MAENLRNKKQSWLVLTGVILLAISVALVIAFMLHGKTTSTSSNGAIDATQSISCGSDTIDYPFYSSVGSERHSLGINAIFHNGKLKTISLTYRIFYGDVGLIERNVADFHAIMNRAFASDGLGADSFGATYSPLPDSIQLSLYTEVENIGEDAAKYFLLDMKDGEYEKSAVINGYSRKGLDCIINE